MGNIKVIKRKFKIDIYDVNVNLYLFSNVTILSKTFNKFAKKFDLEDDGSLCYGCIFFNPNDFNEAYYFIDLSNISHNLIAHENTHLALRIFGHNNITLNFDDHEPLALLTGYISEKIYCVCKKIKIDL